MKERSIMLAPFIISSRLPSSSGKRTCKPTRKSRYLFQFVLVALCLQIVLGFQSTQLPSAVQPTAKNLRSVVISHPRQQHHFRQYATKNAEESTTTTPISKRKEDDVQLETELLAENDSSTATAIDADADAKAMEEEIERVKNTMLFLCWGVALLSALDRVAMSVAMVPLSAEFGYTDTMKGSVSSLFSVGYGLGIVPAGILVATASPRVVMACGITVWSIATIATPQAAAYSSMLPLLLARASVGAAESVVLPTLQTLLSSWTTRENKSRSLAAVFSGFHAGTVAAYLISPLVIDYWGDWRNIFTLYGGIGLFWLIPWLLFSKDSPQEVASQWNSGTVIDVAASTDDNNNIDNNNNNNNNNSNDQKKNGIDMILAEFYKSTETLKAAPWGDFIKSKGAWAMLAAHSANNWGLYNNLAWSPTFYSEQYGLNVRDSALFSVLPSVAGAIGGLVAGSIADSMLQDIDEKGLDQEQRDEATTKIRKGFQGMALFIPAMALLTLSSNIPEKPFVAQLLLMGTTGLQAFNAAGYLAANQEKAGERWAGLLYSITSLPAVMIGTFGVYMTGQILDLTNQDWSIVFALNAGVNLLGATAFVALYDSKREFD